jgi:hypothetical protein
MMKLTILQDGELLGDRVLELGLSTYLRLAEQVMVVNGLEGDISSPGKD